MRRQGKEIGERAEAERCEWKRCGEQRKSGKVERERRTETELRQGGRMETERRVREEQN